VAHNNIWVSVDVKLPKKGQLVDVYDADNESRRTDCYYLHDEKQWLWRASHNLCGRNITHWMPLPNSPNSEAKENKMTSTNIESVKCTECEGGNTGWFCSSCYSQAMQGNC